tara:strand:- start:52 stop:375 length:324 start_codon:yes stop_codon:yes gene_type:complete
MGNKDKEFDVFVAQVEKMQQIDTRKDLDEINTNYQKYKIRETNKKRKEIEYFTKQNYKNKISCFCNKGKTVYFNLTDAQEDAEFYNRKVYVCDPINKYRIYHTHSKK